MKLIIFLPKGLSYLENENLVKVWKIKYQLKLGTYFL